MAFRKKFRKFSRRRRQPLARKRVDWFKSYDNNLCQGPDVFPGCKEESAEAVCCTSLGMLTLVANSSLQQEYSDRARVVRMIGQLWMQLDFTQTIIDYATVLLGHPPATALEECEASEVYLSFVKAYMRVGLWKTQVGHDDAGNEIFVGLNPMTDFTYTEGQWKHVWEHAWNPVRKDISSHSGPGFFTNSGCCPVVTGEYSAPDILDGTTVPFTETALDIQTDCQPCAGTPPNDFQALSCSHEFTYPGAWHLSWDKKFKIPLRENERLMLSIGWRAYPATSVALTGIQQPDLQVFGGIRTLLQF